jgi:hypothetical protein
MKIDEAWCHDSSGRIENLRAFGYRFTVGHQTSNLSVLNEKILATVLTRRWVYDMSICYD